jgi:hypothetical protein
MGVIYKHEQADGITQLLSQVWPDAYAGVAQTAKKFAVENVGDRVANNVSCSIEQVGTNDGHGQLRIAQCLNTISKPWNVVATLGAAGGGGVWSLVGQYFWVVTAVNATGETTASLEVTVNVDVTSKRVTLTWTQVTGATGYLVYRSATSGAYVTPCLVATVSGGATTTYIDGGGALSAGAPPNANTTGGAGPEYGTPPTLGFGPLTMGNLGVGQQFFYWVNRVVPGATTDANNPRQALIQFAEN